MRARSLRCRRPTGPAGTLQMDGSSSNDLRAAAAALAASNAAAADPAGASLSARRRARRHLAGSRCAPPWSRIPSCAASSSTSASTWQPRSRAVAGDPAPHVDLSDEDGDGKDRTSAPPSDHRYKIEELLGKAG
ncbi:MAG: hypothetical protein R3F14_10635 [Polyangiaceae bacterium]